MLDALEISKLMWQCAYVYAFRHQTGVSERECKVLRAMRFYFRADERPPQALATRAMGIVSLYKARQKGLNRRLKVATKRKVRLEAASARFSKAQLQTEASRVAAWREELHREAFGGQDSGTH